MVDCRRHDVPARHSFSVANGSDRNNDGIPADRPDVGNPGSPFKHPGDPRTPVAPLVFRIPTPARA
jgi:hypothetical protein